MTNGSSPGGLLFDMDGTLVNTEPLWQAAERKIMGGYGVDWGKAEEAHTHGRSAVYVTNYMADMVAQHGHDRPDPAAFRAEFDSFMLNGIAAGGAVIQAGVPELLESVQKSGVPVGLASSSPRVLVDAVLAVVGTKWFDHTISADDVTSFKPDPQPYLMAADAIGVDPNWCVAIEDSPTGTESAQAAGSYVVTVVHSAVIEPAPRRKLIQDLSGVAMVDLERWFEAP